MNLSNSIMMQINDKHKSLSHELQDELIDYINQMIELEVYAALYIELYTQLCVSIFNPMANNVHESK